MIVTIVGLGLIGGSLALDLRANGFATEIIGVDEMPEHAEIAVADKIVDEVLPLSFGCMKADIVILAIPVNAVVSLLPEVLGYVRSTALVMDMGSTKLKIAEAIKDHSKRKQVVLAHPMAGTEYSGPKAAVNQLFHQKAAILCNVEESDPKHTLLAERLFKSLFMRIIYMDAADHDVHAAYVSHISHISSFVLALTVLEKEKSEANIFNLASGGFASTVRLAKSSPTMWRDVYAQNTDNILDVLNSYIEKISVFRDAIARRDYQQTYEFMEKANEIGRILTEKLPIKSS